MNQTDDLLILGDGPGARELARAGGRLGLRWRQVVPGVSAAHAPASAGWPWPDEGVETESDEGAEAPAGSGSLSNLTGRCYLTGTGGVVVDTAEGTHAWHPRLVALAPRARAVRPSWWRGQPADLDRPAPNAAAGSRPPARVVVIGGGHTGVELAAAWADGRREVLLVEAAERILPQWDADQSAIVQVALADRGVTVLTGSRAVAVETSARPCTVRLRRAGEAADREESADLIVPALGWRPVLASLGLERTRSLGDRDGFLQVDSRLRTAEPGLHALGVAVALPLTRGTAELQAQVIAGAAAGCDPAPLRYAVLPRVAHGPVPVLLAGLTAEAARSRGFQVVSGRSATGDDWVRCVRDAETGQALGVQAAGASAASLERAVLHLLIAGVPAPEDAGPESPLAEAWRRAAADGGGRG